MYVYACIYRYVCVYACLEQAAGGIGLYVNANKMEYMCFNQKGNISP